MRPKKTMQTLTRKFAFRMTETEWQTLHADYEKVKAETGIDFDFADYIRAKLKEGVRK